MKQLKKYKIIWTNKGSLKYEQSFFAQDVQEAIRNLASYNKDLSNMTFDEVKLVIDFE